MLLNDRWASWLRHPASLIVVSVMDILTVVALTFAGLLGVSGVHSGYSSSDQLLGFVFLLPAAGLVLALYASSVNHLWKSALRMIIYFLLTLFMFLVFSVDPMLPYLGIMLWFLGLGLVSRKQLVDRGYWQQRAQQGRPPG